MRLARATAREVLPLDYVKFARAKGLSESRIVGVHVLKNIMIPIATVSGLEFGQPWPSPWSPKPSSPGRAWASC